MAWALDEAGVTPTVTTDVPVVEATLLDGPQGGVVVLANFTYEPIANLTVTVRTTRAPQAVRSVERGDLTFELVDGGIRFQLPLEWTDLVRLTY